MIISEMLSQATETPVTIATDDVIVSESLTLSHIMDRITLLLYNMLITMFYLSPQYSTIAMLSLPTSTLTMNRYPRSEARREGEGRDEGREVERKFIFKARHSTTVTSLKDDQGLHRYRVISVLELQGNMMAGLDQLEEGDSITDFIESHFDAAGDPFSELKTRHKQDKI